MAVFVAEVERLGREVALGLELELLALAERGGC
jgi:hypothetical protein